MPAKAHPKRHSSFHASPIVLIAIFLTVFLLSLVGNLVQFQKLRALEQGTLQVQEDDDEGLSEPFDFGYLPHQAANLHLLSTIRHLTKENSALQQNLPEDQKTDAGLPPAKDGDGAGGIPDEKLKIAYLTFDDGPSVHSAAILDILNEEGVKATFFVIANTSDGAAEKYQRILDEGHALGLHTYTHRYQDIYASADAYIADLDKINALVKEHTGYESKIWRFAGGSVSYKVYGKELFQTVVSHYQDLGYQYFDWNVSGDDAIAPKRTAAEITENVLSTSVKKTRAHILLHDNASSDQTILALPGIIQGLQEQGYTFEVMTPDAPAMHQFKLAN